MGGLVENWFGDSFRLLDPLIQRLHQGDHTLHGPVQVDYSHGAAGRVGQILSQKFGVPKSSGATTLTVNIGQTDECLVWTRKFGDRGERMESKFYPIGGYPDGGWRESTRGFDILLGVEIRNGAWHWKQKSVKILGISAPLFTSPEVVAYKVIVDGKYNFSVEVSLPGLGRLFRYSGLLAAL